MIEGFGVHGTDQRDIIDAGADLREARGNFNAGFAVALELVRAAEQHGGVFLQKSKTNVLCEGIRQLLAVHLIELRFWIEKIDLAGAALHEKKNALLRLRREVRWTNRQRVREIGCDQSI